MPTIEAKILDSRVDGDSTCFLAKFSLYDYLNNLPENYKEYDIQREVVSTNVYLDKMIETVLNRHHIPTIVLVLQKFRLDNNANQIYFEEFNYKIIDGLQRTHRLKIIFDTYKFLKNELVENIDILELSKFHLSKKYSKQLFALKSNFKILSKLLDFYKENGQDIDLIEAIFKTNFIWFELWTDLDSKQQVEKMLLLNAGHKPVKLKHQLELLFINDLLLEFKEKEKFKQFQLIREKDENSTSFAKKREFGQFHFSQLISGLIAFDTGKTIVTNANLVSKLQDNDYSIQDLSNELSYDFVNDIVEFLIDFDNFIRDNYPDETKWFGRETSIVGMFAALGNYRIQNEIERPKDLFNNIIKFLHENPRTLNLNEYDNGRRNLDLSKINFGDVNRRVVFKAFTKILETIQNPGLFHNEPINWDKHFTNYKGGKV